MEEHWKGQFTIPSEKVYDGDLALLRSSRRTFQRRKRIRGQVWHMALGLNQAFETLCSNSSWISRSALLAFDSLEIHVVHFFLAASLCNVIVEWGLPRLPSAI